MRPLIFSGENVGVFGVDTSQEPGSLEQRRMAASSFYPLLGLNILMRNTLSYLFAASDIEGHQISVLKTFSMRLSLKSDKYQCRGYQWPSGLVTESIQCLILGYLTP